MKKLYIEPIIEEDIIEFDDTILSSNIEKSDTNHSFGNDVDLSI